MNEIVPIERIVAARQRLCELSELSPDPAKRKTQVREVMHFFSGFLDDLATLAKDSKQQKEAGCQDQSQL